MFRLPLLTWENHSGVRHHHSVLMSRFLPRDKEELILHKATYWGKKIIRLKIKIKLDWTVTVTSYLCVYLLMFTVTTVLYINISYSHVVPLSQSSSEPNTRCWLLSTSCRVAMTTAWRPRTSVRWELTVWCQSIISDLMPHEDKSENKTAFIKLLWENVYSCDAIFAKRRIT